MLKKNDGLPKSSMRTRFSSPEEAKEALLKRLAKRQATPADHPIFSKGFLIGGTIISGAPTKKKKKEDSKEQSRNKKS